MPPEWLDLSVSKYRKGLELLGGTRGSTRVEASLGIEISNKSRSVGRKLKAILKIKRNELQEPCCQ